MGAGIPITYDDEWIVTNWQDFRNWKKLCEAYNEVHGTDIGYNTFKSHCNRELVLNYHYTQEQQEWLIENYPHLGRVKTAKAFNNKFNENRSAQAIKFICSRLGLRVTEQRKQEIGVENSGRWHPLGTVVKKQHGEPYVKTEDGWKRLKDIEFGDKPRGHVIAHLDNNPDNYSRENLIAIPRSISVKMSKNKFWSEEPVITKTGILCLTLEEALKETS